MSRTHSARINQCLFEKLEQRQLLSAANLPIEAIDASTDLKISPQFTNTNPSGYTPAQIRSAYGITGDGAGQTIAIVDAYDDPSAASDLAKFSTQFGLPQMDGKNGNPTFTKIQPAGRTQTNAGWALETALDIEWAHAVAPKANIVLVEARSASLSYLLSAVDTAANRPGVVSVSMSWGAGEFSSEASYDSHFNKTGVVFLAASGDDGAPAIWPAVASNVVAVGGTTLTDNHDGTYSESAWSGSGGGISAYESLPAYQSALGYSNRAVPDVSYNADPNTGYPVYDSVSYLGQNGWFQVGGTSAASPQWAAIVALADQARNTNGRSDLGGTQLLNWLYGAGASADLTDITSGTTTGNPNYSAASGFDLATGLGTPKVSLLVSDLAVLA